MDPQLTEHRQPHDVAASISEAGNSYCPECGQSLDLSHHFIVSTGQRTWESYVFAILGLFLVVVFGLNASRAHRGLFDIDQQIADSLASIKVDAYRSLSDQEREIASTVNR